MVDIVQPLEWDSEARTRAVRQAQEVNRRDPEAAALLIAQVVAIEKSQQEQGYVEVSALDYKPAELYAYACKTYGWRPRDCDDMHYPTFFAMIREANETVKREKEQYESYK